MSILKEFCIETRLSNIFKTATVTKSTKNILESSYRVLEVISKWKTLKQPAYFLKTVEFWPTFDIQFDFQINFGYILGIIAKPLFLERPQKSLKGGQHSYQEGHPLRNNSLSVIWKICIFLTTLFSKEKLLTFWIFDKSDIWN